MHDGVASTREGTVSGTRVVVEDRCCDPRVRFSISPADKGIGKLAKTLGFDYADAVVCTPPYPIVELAKTNY